MELDNGLRPIRLARTLQRVYAIVMLDGVTDEDLDDLIVTEPWKSVTDFVLLTYGASIEADANFTVPQFAFLMHKAFCRDAANAQPFEALPVREQLAWEILARHAAGVCQTDEDGLGDLDRVERSWGVRVHEYARKRGVTLEQQNEVGTAQG